VRALVGRFRGKTIRYATVSVVCTALTQVMLFGFVDGLGWSGAISNVVAVCVTSVPGYFGNRAWVWGKRGDHSMSREAAPFWAMNLAGLALSTVFAAIAYAVYDAGWAVSLANMAGFGVLWVAKFLVLDEYLFAMTDTVTDVTSDITSEATTGEST
jgi:putative flippase GtrA